MTIDQAARDTRIRREVLEGLEAERFERLSSQVHVRGSLRTYAGYLGLPAEEFVDRYRRSATETEEEQPPPEEIRPLLRERDNRLAILFGVALLAVAGAFGALSSRPGSPEPADLGGAVPAVAPGRSGVLLAVTARDRVDVVVRVDGGAEERFRLAAGESRSFEAADSVQIHLSDGRGARVVVNGVDQGFPGERGSPWNHVYRPGDPEVLPPPSPTAEASGPPEGDPSEPSPSVSA